MNQKLESALGELRRSVWPVPDAETEARRRVHIANRVSELQAELLVSSQRRRRHGFGIAAAALLFGGILAFALVGSESLQRSVTPTSAVMAVRLIDGHASRVDGPALRALERGAIELASDSILVTNAGAAAELRLASDTALSVAPSSRVGLARHQPPGGGFDERIQLQAGSVALAVPKLGERDTLAVETKDTVIEVRGTRFSVSMVERPPLEAFTEVKVTEGRVLVVGRGTSELIGAGQSWRSVDPPPGETSAPLPPEAASPAAPPPGGAARPSRAAPPAQRAAVPASELATQNRLLEAAELAQKSGMPALALERIERLLTEFPDAELAHNARVQRFRLLRELGRTREAAAAAQQYLERHPRGFAAQEARRLITTASVPEQ